MWKVLKKVLPTLPNTPNCQKSTYGVSGNNVPLMYWVWHHSN